MVLRNIRCYFTMGRVQLIYRRCRVRLWNINCSTPHVSVSIDLICAVCILRLTLASIGSIPKELGDLQALEELKINGKKSPQW